MPLNADSPRLIALKSAPLNSWIALSADETSIVATGATYEEVARALGASGADDAVVLKTPECWAPLSV